MQARKISLWLSSLLVLTLPVARLSTEDFVRRCLIGDRAMAEMSLMGNPERGWGQVSPLLFRSGAVIEPVEERMLVGADKIVLVDCFYNNEWRKGKEGRPVRYHYVWDDTTNSGFSILGRIISKLGAAIDTLCEAPTMQSLSGASIYIIVDPDTPLETEHPNFIDARAIDAIVKWVRKGGVLLLMGNDKGNAEFEHFNELAAQFGIRFNEDSRNRVTGKDYDVGKFDSFPDHPLFKGVKQIFIKELSTLSAQEPATVIFSDRGDAIMAFARLGKGVVFAVGDPWLYNEYMDHRRLPEGYENDKAAENLFRWLLENAAPVRAD
jgi:unsaturated rhamnogalacturonyl hydrolase